MKSEANSSDSTWLLTDVFSKRRFSTGWADESPNFLFLFLHFSSSTNLARNNSVQTIQKKVFHLWGFKILFSGLRICNWKRKQMTKLWAKIYLLCNKIQKTRHPQQRRCQPVKHFIPIWSVNNENSGWKLHFFESFSLSLIFWEFWHTIKWGGENLLEEQKILDFKIYSIASSW